MAWAYLLAAGLFEIGFTTFMELDGVLSDVLFVVCAIISFWLLTRATRTIPLSTAYAVWTAIGAVGTVIVGIVGFGDPVTFWRLFFLAAIVAIVIGLKVISGRESAKASER